MARELDALLLRAAQISTSSVDVETVRTTLRGAQIDDATRQDIAMAAETIKIGETFCLSISPRQDLYILPVHHRPHQEGRVYDSDS